MHKIWYCLKNVFRCSDIETVAELCGRVQLLLDDRYVGRQTHEDRVRGLLDANSRKVDEIRLLKRELVALEKDAARAVKRAHENVGIAKAFDWIALNLPADAPFYRVREHTVAFVAGFTGQPRPLGQTEQKIAYEAGSEIRARHDTIVAAAKTAGLPAGD